MSSKPANQFICGVLLGGLFFFAIYDVSLLNPKNISWMLSGDTGQHYLGWRFFRNEPWHLPPGRIERFGFPLGTSITYTDSLPLLALPLKLLRSYLPVPFQYHGWWYLLCCALQGGFGFLILSRLSLPFMARVFALPVFLFSPVMHFRIPGHSSLGAHWLILWVIFLYIRETRLPAGSATEPVDQKTIWKWAIPVLLGVFVHAYILFMLCLFLVAFLCQRKRLSGAKWRAFSKPLMPFFLAMVACLWICGYFVVGTSYATAGFGTFSMNLNGFFNPASMSLFLPSLPLVRTEQMEGFSYLGLGVLILLGIALLLLVVRRELRGLGRQILSARWRPLFYVFVFLGLLAVSNRMSFGNWIFLDIHNLVGRYLEIGAIFRSSGRLIWPFIYFLTVMGIWYLARALSRYPVVLAGLLLVISVVQVADLRPQWKDRKNMGDGSSLHPSVLASDFWQEVPAQYRHFVFYPALEAGELYLPFGMVAAPAGRTMNIAYLARENSRQHDRYVSALHANIERGKFDEESLYIFNFAVDRARLACEIQDAYIADIDGFHLMARGPRSPQATKILIRWGFSLQKNDECSSSLTLMAGR